MSGADGLVSCVGGCNSKLFNSRRVHRPLVNNISQPNIHLLQPSQSVLEKSAKCPSNRYRKPVDIPPIICHVPNVKKSRKRRDRKYHLFLTEKYFGYNFLIAFLERPERQKLQLSVSNIILKMTKIHRNDPDR